MSKSLEIVNAHIEMFKNCQKAYAHASDIETANKYKEDIKIFETIKQDLEAYEQLKQDHDKTLINNGELCVKVAELEKALDKACERLDWDCPVSQDLIDDCKGCWKKYFLNLADVEVLEYDQH